jgi:ribosomal protein L3 glutamine methyltransferase
MMQERITLVMSDCLDHAVGPYDLILCNPPYVNASSMDALPREYRAEPHLSLSGGEDGMDFIRRFLAEVHHYLSDIGVIVLEIGNERENFEKAFPALECFWLETTNTQDQVVLITRSQLLSGTAQ